MKLIFLAIAASLALLSVSAWSAGGGGGGAGGGEAQNAAPSDPDFATGLQAWKNKDWPQVLAHMSAVVERDANNADAWNYMGHAARQLGDMDNAFKNYQRALQINPKHRGAHEYMGEAYLMVGQLAQAEEHLKALDKLCFFPCEEYTELKEKVQHYRRDHPQ